MTNDFDVFLAHNSRDKPAVREIADALAQHGLRVWLDEQELMPGRPWQEAIEEVIQHVESVAVLVGKDGIGPWEMHEIRAVLDESIKRQLRVIPVLLPDAPSRPDLPLLLAGFTWVDLRGGLTDAKLERLIWGITGQKHRESQAKPKLPEQVHKRSWIVARALPLVFFLAILVLAVSGKWPTVAPKTREVGQQEVVQSTVPSLAALVRITGTRGDERMPPGSGFVVALEGDLATIVTASHVLEGARCEVEFAVSADRVAVGRILGLEAGDRHGLAAFRVRGVPAGVTVLELDAETPIGLGEPLLLAGFPQMASRPRVKQGVFSGPNGPLLLVDRAAGEGASGGPVLRGGKAVGVITTGGVGEEYASAVSALVARAILAGWGVKPGTTAQVASRPSVSQPSTPKCQLGEEGTFEGIEFVRICGGTFIMGSAADDDRGSRHERPTHEVALTEFWIAKYETSNQQYRRFRQDHNSGRADDLPAEDVSWNRAKSFCERFGFRLPTEAEWEYAARAGRQATWSFGSDEGELGRYAWYGANSGGKVHPVGTREANSWGLHDMHGNVWEWVANRYSPYSRESQSDPKGPGDDSPDARHMLRGGGYSDEPRDLRSANRVRRDPSLENRDFGFRCVLRTRSQP